jgi:hypothetical protein
MYPVFGRRELNYDAQFQRWLRWTKAGADAYKAMARNTMYDHRVQKERADKFHTDYAASQILEEALTQYFEECVRKTGTPDFLQAVNSGNIVAGAPDANLIDEDKRLVTFLDLNGLHKLYLWAKQHPRSEYRDVFDHYIVDGTDGQIGNWLGETIASLGDQVVVFAALAVKRAVAGETGYRHFHPVWAALWKEFGDSLTQEEVDRWWERVGVFKSTRPRWVVPLTYTVFEAGTLVRPTILDSGFYAHHFPSPPQMPPQDGGCCMDLQTDPKPAVLTHEYIHQEIAFEERHWINAGSLCLPTSQPSPVDLAQQRRNHHELLKSLPNHTPDWMPECI